jgi:hypothetical protein
MDDQVLTDNIDQINQQEHISDVHSKAHSLDSRNQLP